jgi:lambda family phage portal protein
MTEVTPIRKRRYDAGSAARRVQGWNAPGTDATAAITNPTAIRNRARDLVRNNPWAAKALMTIVNNAIGFGIRCQVQAASKVRKQKVQAIWRAWAETTACDADGSHDFYGLQALAFRSLVESGECLIRLRPRRVEDGLPVPLQLQVIEPDLLGDQLGISPEPGNTIRRGIEFDPLGRRVAYHLYKQHPGADIVGYATSSTSRVPASDVIHLYRKDRPGQERGVSWLAPVLMTLRELDIYEDASLKRQQISNMFAGFVSSEDPASMEDEFDDSLPDMEPGLMYLLRPGQSITFSQPPAAEDPKFRDSCLRRVAAGLGITYESLTGNLSEVNFSSARMGAHEFGRNIDAWQWSLFIPRVCSTVFGWFVNALALQGLASPDLRAEWTPPARTLVDPAKEYGALLTAVKAGFITLPEAIRQQGYDPDAVLAEQADYLAKLDAAGVMVESDYRHKAASLDPTITEALTGANNA